MSPEPASILVVYPRFEGACNPDAGGAENRTYHLLDQLSKEFDVTLLEPDDATYPDGCDLAIDRRTFRRFTPQFLTDLNPFYIRRLMAVLRDEEVDAFQVESLGGILVAAIAKRVFGLDGPVVYGSHNVEADRVQSVVNPDLPLYKRLGAPVFIPLLERLGVRLADHVLAVSDADRESFIRRYGIDSDVVTTIPSGLEPVDVDELSPRNVVRETFGFTEDETLIVFHGTYANYANREAIEIIQEEIAPKVAERQRDVTFVLAGRGMPELETDNIRSVGFVEDLDSFLSAMDLAIVPLVRGGGTKLKVFDYLRVGLPIISTEVGIEGIGLGGEKEAIVLPQVGENFIDAIIREVTSDGPHGLVGQGRVEFDRSKHDWNSIGDDLITLYFNNIPEQ